MDTEQWTEIAKRMSWTQLRMNLNTLHRHGVFADESMVSFVANKLRDPWGEIHPREVHPSMYDARRMQPSEFGIEYLKPIFTNSIGVDDMEAMRMSMFSPGSLSNRYQSVNTDVRKRIRFV